MSSVNTEASTNNEQQHAPQPSHDDHGHSSNNGHNNNSNINNHNNSGTSAVSSSSSSSSSKRVYPLNVHLAAPNYDFALPQEDCEPIAYKEYIRCKALSDPKVQERYKSWSKVLGMRQHLLKTQKYELTPKDKTAYDVKTFAREGISPEFRGRVWLMLSGAAEKREKNEGIYNKLKKKFGKKTSKLTQQIDAVRTHIIQFFALTTLANNMCTLYLILLLKTTNFHRILIVPF